MNPLENRLKSWRPRAPSASLKRRLFGRTATPVHSFLGSDTPPASPWLVPSLGGAVMIFITIVGLNLARVPAPREDARAPLGLFAVSNQAGIASLSADSNRSTSRWSMKFASTNTDLLPPVKGSYVASLSPGLYRRNNNWATKFASTNAGLFPSVNGSFPSSRTNWTD